MNEQQEEEVDTTTILCVPVELPREQWLEAAKKAQEINPENVPPGVILDELPGDSDRLAVEIGKRWPRTGVRLTVGFLDNPSQELRRKILSHMNAWSNQANIEFVETSASRDAQVRIARTPGQGFFSYLGTDILSIPRDRKTMNLAGFTMKTRDSEFFRVVRHETGHTLGFPHEHRRKEIVEQLDREKTIKWGIEELGWSRQTVIDQILTPLEERSIIATPRTEERSIMCYQLPGKITVHGRPIPGGSDISDLDYEFSGRLYPKRPRSMAEPQVKASR